jgi:hypothetical protein
VRDQEADLLGVAGHQLQGDHGADAAAEDVGGLGRLGGEEPVDVVGVGGDGRRPCRVVDGASGQAATVIGEHGVGIGEVRGQVVTGGGVPVAARDEQEQRAAAASPVPQPGAGHVQRANSIGFEMHHI